MPKDQPHRASLSRESSPFDKVRAALTARDDGVIVVPGVGLVAALSTFRDEAVSDALKAIDGAKVVAILADGLRYRLADLKRPGSRLHEVVAFLSQPNGRDLTKAVAEAVVFAEAYRRLEAGEEIDVEALSAMAANVPAFRFYAPLGRVETLAMDAEAAFVTRDAA